MEDKIIKTSDVVSNMTVILKDGTKIPVKAKTTETFWESGRKDCHVEILEPLNTKATKEEK